ncbi:hypothetical protein E3P92_03045 [Wallemia ichthyophaga]|nr:hypothetical protein E3P92_03045 [Wallemia ichthyophaga]TIB31594.1 hypothetical protein E3P84_02868 [Wallemia ichthyophaga]TIB40642.1 hypothetical protein E3P83_02796 [Wallemia ichthyophaga]
MSSSTTFFVRAAYNYQSHDSSSLPFVIGDVIEVLTTLDSGWWDGLLGNDRGWFPSNHVIKISDDEAAALLEQDILSPLPESQNMTPDEYWIPQASLDGNIYYFNTQTGQQSLEMPNSAYLPTFNGSPSVDHQQSPSITPTNPIYSQMSTANPTSTNVTREFSSDLNSNSFDNFDLLTLKDDDLQVAIALRPAIQPSLEDLSAQAIVALEALINASSLNWTAEASAIGRRDSDIEGPIDEPNPSNLNDSNNSNEDQLSQHRQNVHFKQSNEIEIAIETATDSIRSVLFSTGILNSSVSIKSLPSSIISLKATQRRLTAALSKCTLTSEATKSILCFLPTDESGRIVKKALEQMNEDVADLQNILQDFIESALDVRDGLPSRQTLAVLGPRSESLEIMHVTTVRRRRDMGKPTLLQLEQLGGDAREALRSLNQFLAQIKQDEEVISTTEIKEDEEAQPDSDLEVDPEMNEQSRSQSTKSKEKKVETRTVNKLPAELLPSIQSCLVTLTRFCNSTEEVDVLPMLDFDGLPPPTHPPDSPILGQDVTTKLSANDSQYMNLVTKAHSFLHEFEKAKLSLSISSGNALVQLQDLISMNLAEIEVCEALIGCISKDISKIESSSSDVLESLLSLVEIADIQYQLTSNEQLSGPTQIGERSLQLSKLEGGQSIRSSKSAAGAPMESVADDDSDIGGMEPSNSGDHTNRHESDSASSPHSRTHSHSQTTSSQYTTQVVSVEELQEQHKFAQRQKLQKLLGESGRESLPSNTENNTNSNSASLGRVQRPSQSSTNTHQTHFLDSDYGTSLILQPNGSVKGGTVPALVERLTTHEHSDLKFSKTFLMTYTSFSTSEEVFDLLIRRFHLCPPDWLVENEITMWREKKQMVVQLRVINVMKSWLEHHFDENRDNYILERVRHFADSDIPMTIVGPVRYLKKIVERRESRGGLEPKKIITAQNFPPQPILPKNSKKLKLMDIDPLEMARQLTIIESHNFNRIKPDECLNKNWSGPEHLKKHKARNIRTMIQLSNRLAAWVTHSVLGMGDDSKKRAAMVKWFIYVAERCRALNNFSTMAGIIAGINSPPIRRLKRTWDQMSQKALNIQQSLDTTIDSTKNFANYKQLLRNINPPCVPFLGVYLTYLTFITDGNPDFLKDAERGGQQLTSPPGGGPDSFPLVNFAKRQMAADLISEIQQYQATPYNFTPIPQISKIVLQQLEESDSAPDAFPISLKLEPRERDDEKMARMLSESGFF